MGPAKNQHNQYKTLFNREGMKICYLPAGCCDLVNADAMATAAALDRPPNAVGPTCVAVSCLTGMGFFSVSNIFLVSCKKIFL